MRPRGVAPRSWGQNSTRCVRLILGGLALASLTALPVSLAATDVTAATPNSSVSALFSEPAAGYGFLFAAVARARHDIDLSIYELKDPLFEEALVHQAARGIRVRVLLNAAYYGRRENAAAAATLSRGGVHVAWAPSGQIFHAKYLVVDDARVYIGSGNLVSYYYSSTRDFWVLDDTPGDVAAVESTFTNDLHGSALAPRISGGLVWSPGAGPALAALIGSARHTLIVENEEMNSDPIEAALDAAVARGVQVVVIMNSPTRYLTQLTELARRGVHVVWHTSSQLYIHAKAICADCASISGRAFVGSENFSTSSLEYNRELGVLTQSKVVLRSLAATLASDAASGTPLRP